ncbi:ABC transporter substrate-binding protein [Vibrio sp. JC009]|uniref:ABC transporter substrate-binding protein n=1 Tax=Vibrio sp. JC009 TaxID=2912314 RepID=UPI0023B0016A|nr:ABC transporter substrate-binding protein [Vibrio sp. JC009]WED20777.1 ABC transporter substrate-binding protein [Vibrio sp. JC009]
MRTMRSVFAAFIILFCFQAKGFASEPIHIYVDADRTAARTSGVAIERGIRVALDEVGNQIAGRPVKVLTRDHHGSAVRSKLHLKEYLSDENALAVFSGLHSPPLLENLRFIHDHQILVLDPWAAAGPITRYPSEQNWVFRLSVDDTKAGRVIVNHALAEGFTKPYLLLEDTGWGKSNYKTMSQALAEQGISPIGVKWFNWNLGSTGAKMSLRDIYASGADVILMVANASEGKTFARALLKVSREFESKKALPIRSHWGITGGDFPQVINPQMRKEMDIKFLQTRFSFISSPPTPLSESVLARAKRLYPEEIRDASDITAPTGFIHAYDLTKLMLAAINRQGLSGDIQADRLALRSALEQIDGPVEGLIKTYRQPFSPYSESRPDAHEALGHAELVMGEYDMENRIVIVQE